MTNVVLEFGGIIPTNTPALKEYALSVLLAHATFFVEQWNLDVQLPITTNQITHFSPAVPTTNGVRAGIRLNDRYGIGIYDGRVGFTDMRFYDGSFIGNDERIEALLKERNVLTLEAAVALAREKLKQIGIDEEEHGLGGPLKAGQWRYDTEAHRLPLYVYEVRWNSMHGSVHMQVSGVTSNVASLFQTTRAPSLHVPVPANYLEMLGLPEDTVFLPHDYKIRRQIEALKKQEEEERLRPQDADAVTPNSRKPPDVAKPPTARPKPKESPSKPKVTDSNQAPDTLLSVAELWVERLGIGVPLPLANQITLFQAGTNELGGTIRLGDRYDLVIRDGMVESFTDLRFNAGPVIRGGVDYVMDERYTKDMPDALTLETALGLAKTKLSQVGIDEERAGPPVGIIRLVRSTGEEFYPLPLYEVSWNDLRMQISGITTNVVEFSRDSPSPHSQQEQEMQEGASKTQSPVRLKPRQSSPQR